MIKFPTGQTTDGADIFGNDGRNRSTLLDIDNESKRARYSIVALVANGPSLIGVESKSSGLSSTFTSISGQGFAEPNLADATFALATVVHGTGSKIEMHYTALQPFVFLNGQMFITTVEVAESPLSYTQIVVQKLKAGSSTELETIENRLISNNSGTIADGKCTHQNKIVDLTNGGAYFATGERLIVTITPDGNTGASSTSGLAGVSAIIWLKVLHKQRNA